MRVYDSRRFLIVGVLSIVATLAVHGASIKETAVVKDVAFTSNGQSLEVDITSTASTKFTYFELDKPRRLVVDFHGIRNNIGFKEKQVDSAGVERIRTSYFNGPDRKATRIVFDLNSAAHYQVSDRGDGFIRVVFGGTPDKPAPSNRAPMNLVAGPAVAPPAAETSGILSAKVQPEAITLKPEALQLASAAPLAPVTAAFATPLRPQAAPGTPAQYTGEIVTFDLKDVDFKDFFRLIGDLSGLNVVLDPNVTGTLTIRLIDVPWDQALDIVLKNYNFGKQLEGNVLRIASTTTLQNEENQRKAQRDAQELSAELVTHTYVLNYTKANIVSGSLTKMLSARGNIIEDLRRNALVVSDIPAQFGRVDQMIKFLDTPAQQVEIEARLLSANKSFSKDIGSQLGFLFGNKSGNVLTGGSGSSSPFDRNPAPRATTGGSSLPLAANFPAAATSGLAFLMQPGGDILLDEIITAAESRGTARLISRPHVMAQNNTPANVSQGTQIPVQTNVNNTISVQFLNFALKLIVTPQITEAGTILLTVSIENSQPDFARAVNGIPSVATQQATTQVLIPDGGTAGIAGILVDTDSVNVRQVPGLGSIPVIGHLFKETATIKSTSELLFFITARIKPLDTLNETVPGAPAVPQGD